MWRALLLAACLLATSPARAGFDWLGKIDAAADDLKAKSSEDRARAVRELARFDIRWTQRYLLAALSDPTPAVRIAAGRVLGAHRITKAAPAVAAWLTEADVGLRTAAAEILGQLRTPTATPALIRALGDPEADVRTRAVAALGQIGDKTAVIPVIGRLEDEKSEVRLAAVQALADLGDARAVVQMVGAFNDSSIEIRQLAITAVGKLGDDAAIPALMRLLRDRAVRAAAATALGQLGAREAVQPMITDLQGERSDNSYRAVVATALGRIARAAKSGAQTDAAVHALVEGLADQHLRKACREALVIAGRPAVPALIAHLGGRISGDPRTAVELLRQLRDPRSTQALIEELGRRRLDRALVLDALSAAGDEKALIPIIALLRDRDPEVRLASMRALEPLVEGDSRAADIVVDLLKDREIEIQVLAARYLGIMRAEIGVGPLVALAKNAKADSQARKTALVALGEIGSDAGAAVALEILGSSATELHRAATTALVYMAPTAMRDRLAALASGRPGGPRLEALRALAAVVRDRPDAHTRKILLQLASSGPAPTSLAALDALGAMADPASRTALRRLAESPDPARRAAAISALARVDASPGRFIRALRSRDDRVSGAAARALEMVGIGTAVDALAYAAERGGLVTQINASAALARHLPADRAAVLSPLLHHRNPAVRANAIFALGRLRSARARPALETLLAGDASWVVRVAATRALSRIGDARKALERAAKTDPIEEVREAAKRALEVEFAPDAPTEWRSFHFVDPAAGMAPVTEAPYVIIGSDGVALGVYSDARGEALLERFSPGEHLVKPADRLGEL